MGVSLYQQESDQSIIDIRGCLHSIFNVYSALFINETYINVGATTTEHLNSVLLQIKLTTDSNPSGIPTFDLS